MSLKTNDIIAFVWATKKGKFLAHCYNSGKVSRKKVAVLLDFVQITSTPLIWTKSKRTATFFRDAFPKITLFSPSFMIWKTLSLGKIDRNKFYHLKTPNVSNKPYSNQIKFPLKIGGRCSGTLAWSWCTPSPTRGHCQGSPIGQETLWQRLDRILFSSKTNSKPVRSMPQKCMFHCVITCVFFIVSCATTVIYFI